MCCCLFRMSVRLEMLDVVRLQVAWWTQCTPAKPSLPGAAHAEGPRAVEGAACGVSPHRGASLGCTTGLSSCCCCWQRRTRLTNNRCRRTRVELPFASQHHSDDLMCNFNSMAPAWALSSTIVSCEPFQHKLPVCAFQVLNQAVEGMAAMCCFLPFETLLVQILSSS